MSAFAKPLFASIAPHCAICARAAFPLVLVSFWIIEDNIVPNCTPVIKLFILTPACVNATIDVNVSNCCSVVRFLVRCVNLSTLNLPSVPYNWFILAAFISTPNISAAVLVSPFQKASLHVGKFAFNWAGVIPFAAILPSVIAWTIFIVTAFLACCALAKFVCAWDIIKS